jgi:hypothetical protein
MGGSGYMREYPYEQALRDCRINLIFEGTNEILRLFVALSGMKGVGEYLKVVGQALNDPIKSLGTLKNFVVRKITKTITRDRLTMVGDLFKDEALMVEDQVALFASAVENLLRRHGRDIVNREFAQKRIANAAIDLYSIFATLSRVTDSIRRNGEDACAEEVIWHLKLTIIQIPEHIPSGVDDGADLVGVKDLRASDDVILTLCASNIGSQDNEKARINKSHHKEYLVLPKLRKENRNEMTPSYQTEGFGETDR